MLSREPYPVKSGLPQRNAFLLCLSVVMRDKKHCVLRRHTESNSGNCDAAGRLEHFFIFLFTHKNEFCHKSWNPQVM